MLPVEDTPGYRVLDQAGQGGFAIVYRAYQERLDRVVALKVLSVDKVDQKTMRRFQRELQLTGRLTGHPNVVTVFDTGVTRSGKPYIAMDFFEHGSLRDKVRKEGPLPVPDVLRAGVKLAGALAAVHEAGVLHGDIKPQNILISRYGEPAIADFGVARVVDSSEVSAMAQAFTPLHAAPEVLSGQPHSVSTDIYSLGSTLYHLLAGQPAFHSPTDPSIAPLMYRVLSNEPPPINRSDVPPAVFEVILRAMAKQPQARYDTARAFAQRLRQVQGELGLSITDLVGEDPGPGPNMATVPRNRGDADPPSFGTGAQLPGGAAPTQGPFTAPPPAQGYGGPNQAPPHAPPQGYGGPNQAPPQHYGAYTGSRYPQVGPAGQVGRPGEPLTPTDPRAGVIYTHTPETVDPYRAAPPPPPSRVKIRLAIGASVAAVAIAGAGFAVYLSRQNTPVANPKQTTPQQTTAREDTIDKRTVAALAPRQVKVSADNGQVVELTWKLPTNALRYPVILQRSPVKANEQRITALSQGTTSTRVVGLDPNTGYCFLVGVPLQISKNSTVAWSKPTCIRGAVAKG